MIDSCEGVTPQSCNKFMSIVMMCVCVCLLSVETPVPRLQLNEILLIRTESENSQSVESVSNVFREAGPSRRLLDVNKTCTFIGYANQIPAVFDSNKRENLLGLRTLSTTAPLKSTYFFSSLIYASIIIFRNYIFFLFLLTYTDYSFFSYLYFSSSSFNYYFIY